MIQALNKISISRLQRQLIRGAVSVGLAVSILYLIRADLFWFAVLLAAASKWQILIGGLRLWLHNAWDNGIDIVVLTSYVALLVVYSQDPAMQWVIVATYLGWQLLIKPLEGFVGRGMQALFALGIGIGALFLYKQLLGIAAMIIIGWLIAMLSASHVLISEDEKLRHLGSVVWALIVSQFIWVFSHWTVYYPFFNGRLLIPQAALVVIALGYAFGNIYYDHTHRLLRKKRLYGYLGFISLVVIGLIFGSEWVSQL